MLMQSFATVDEKSKAVPSVVALKGGVGTKGIEQKQALKKMLYDSTTVTRRGKEYAGK